MKKKIYIVPQTLAINVQLQQIIAGSGGDKLMSGKADANGTVLSREKDWFDDEE